MGRDQGFNLSSSQGSSVLDVKPLRCLTPMFPGSLGFTASIRPGAPPFVCISPFADSGSQQAAGFPTNVSASFQTPPPMILPLNSDAGMCVGTTSKRGRKGKKLNHLKIHNMDDSDREGSKKKKLPRQKNIKAHDLVVIPSSADPRETVEVILMTFDALRRKLLQVEEVNNLTRRPDLKAGAIMMDNDLRTNVGKIMGSLPGVEVGDIFYFRFELCLVGLHSPSMAGIDYISSKSGNQNEPLAISIVSSGGYEDESDDVDILIYSGQGGSKLSNRTKQIDDQKLERGNLALERSLHRANQIRVIRGTKDISVLNGKIYYYDGLYKIHESWVDKGKAGFNIFKYKLLREPGQPDGCAIWKMTEKWRENPSSRGKVILPDLASGEESIPVCLVNEFDMEKGPELFSYSTEVRYLRSISSMKNLQGCSCQNVCLPGDSGCSCAQQNGGELPYSSTGLLVSHRPLIYECSSMCQCTANCRNRVTQKGIKFRFEVFRTANRGWGLRSWDPIRAGSFVCEYTGEVIDMARVDYDVDEDDYIFKAGHGGDKIRWNCIPELLGERSLDSPPESSNSLPIIISAKRIGNLSRFMNHSCSPNTFWQPVQHDHGDEGHPHIMFFAMKHIPPMTELTYDYGQSDHKSKQCLCGSPKCRESYDCTPLQICPTGFCAIQWMQVPPVAVVHWKILWCDFMVFSLFASKCIFLWELSCVSDILSSNWLIMYADFFCCIPLIKDGLRFFCSCLPSY